MKFYKNLVDAVLEGLHQIHNQEGYADQVVPKLLKSNKKWGSKDRKFIAEHIYTITRYRRLYYFLADVKTSDSKKELWAVFAAYCIHKDFTLPDWEEFTSIDQKAIQQRIKQAEQEFVLKESIPDWLNELGEESLGKENWQKEIAAQNQPAEVVLRINPIAVPKQERENARDFIQNELQKENISTEIVENYPHAIQLAKRSKIAHTKAYKKGWIEIQDASSQLVAPFTGAKKGMRVIDACAGAGGKTLHLASLMENQGELLALEIIRWKLDELKKRAERAKITIVETDIPDLSVLREFENSADVVLIDAPCSGLGTIKRKADLKWKISPLFIEQQIALQQQILKQYAPLVKSEGVLVYATCSILPQENEQQIQQFLESDIGKNFVLEEQQQIFAYQTGYDGFYMARMKRK